MAARAPPEIPTLRLYVNVKSKLTGLVKMSSLQVVLIPLPTTQD